MSHHDSCWVEKYWHSLSDARTICSVHLRSSKRVVLQGRWRSWDVLALAIQTWYAVEQATDEASEPHNMM